MWRRLSRKPAGLTDLSSRPTLEFAAGPRPRLGKEKISAGKTAGYAAGTAAFAAAQYAIRASDVPLQARPCNDLATNTLQGSHKCCQFR
jgi:hypothetical protein